MMEWNDRLEKLTLLLLKKTKANKLHWEEEIVRTTSWRKFETILSGSSVRIGFVSPSSAPDRCGIWVSNSFGDTIDKGLVTEQSIHYSALFDLYDYIRREVDKVDETYDSIFNQLED